MNYLRNFKNRFAVKLELVSALVEGSFLIDPPQGFTDESIPVGYDGIYFTINAANLSEKSKPSKAGTAYTVALDLSFPMFGVPEVFKERFRQLSEIKVTFNTGEMIRLNKNDIALNRPMDAEFSSNLKNIGMSVQINNIFPLKFE